MRDNDPFSDLIRSIEESLQKGGDDGKEPPRSEQRPEPPQINPRRLLIFIIPFLILIFFFRGLGFYADWFWYDSLGLSSVFLTRITASVSLFLVGAIGFWLIFAINVLLARRLAPHGMNGTPIEELAIAFGVRLTPVFLIVGAVLAFFTGLSTSGAWEDVLIYLNQTTFNIMDPVFERDVSFFMFTLPIWQMIKSWLLTTLIISLIATAVANGVAWQRWNVRTSVLAHLGILASLVLLLVAWQYRIDAFQLVYSTRGAVFGAGYTDIHAQLPAYNILSIVTLVAAVLLIVTVYLRQAWRAILGVLVVWFAVSIIAGNIYPSLVQSFQVQPNELNLERPYIENNIEFTQAAFDLADIEVRDYDASLPLTGEALIGEPETVTNIRLWDYRPLLQTYNQIQALRQYYAFNNVDIDRYTIDGEVRQVMIAARELVPEQLEDNAQTWFNRKLVYTHGYGVTMSPVAQITRDGLPEFLIKDLPPQGVITVTQPQIYFGELTDDYVIAATDEPEFDYPSGAGNVTTSFKGNTGIAMSFLTRLLFAFHFADVNILLNSGITPDSQLLWRRNIEERVQEVAPFLGFDSDPYIVIDDSGKLHWFIDAYTMSNSFPYSKPVGSINYIRNSVKIVINAYDGSMNFYIVDPEEPIIAAYAQIFPELFSDIDTMPADLKEHIRYPNDLFKVQSEIYRTYHMTDATEFYNREDVWAWPAEIFEGQPQRMEPYYVLMELPDSNDLDFIQILPFTPDKRENMIAWFAAQNDPDKYGEKLVYQFGKDSLIFGPQQIEARIDQDPTISAQLSLWNQQGSNVIRGNLLVIPIGESLLYVEPLYLQAASGKIPELKRVIVATVDQVIMAENLGLALAELFGSDVLAEAKLQELAATEGGEIIISDGEGSSATAVEIPNVNGVSVEALIIDANNRYANAQTHLKNGNWASYGREMDSLQIILEQLAVLAEAEEATAEEGADTVQE